MCAGFPGSLFDAFKNKGMNRLKVQCTWVLRCPGTQVALSLDSKKSIAEITGTIMFFMHRATVT